MMDASSDSTLAGADSFERSEDPQHTQNTRIVSRMAALIPGRVRLQSACRQTGLPRMLAGWSKTPFSAGTQAEAYGGRICSAASL
jgi:hypothetical protein